MQGIYFVAFWIFQLLSSIIFRYGGLYPKYHWAALIAGNILLLSASWFLIQLFRVFPQPLVIACCAGGTFVSVQLGMALYFKQSLSWIHVLGMLLIVLGIVVTTFAESEQKKRETQMEKH